ncbi:PepSY domain-containing protein [Altericroceibacterium spongiae]|uniref:PepSY domain-containing protein n=1 Tax=Altericroceibacterium spongiae TaxID=2320269 RepID=A0A420EMG5_9SPHN|nr:PepSY-associated TM helix domain-containing protein [Altericroceibacterium spongiae]RKF21821.1 PepSY domain-containing protein [Altericroceibacterium spongiae]
MSSNRTSPKNNRWPLSPATVRAVLSGHSILGLAFAAIIYLVCLTGTLAVFVPDIEQWEQPAAPVAKELSDKAAARAVQTALPQVPQDITIYLSLPTEARQGATLHAYNTTFDREWAVNAQGALTEMTAVWSEFLIHLHINLHLPRSWGDFIVGMSGVALLSSLLSGILAHPRIIRDAFHLRLGGSRRLQEADIHNRLGVWALPFHFTLALTGALLGLSTIIVAVLSLLLYQGDMNKVYDLFLDTPLPENTQQVEMPDLETLIAEARQHAPGATPQAIMIEHPGRADMRISVSSGRDNMIAMQDQTKFDAKGAVLKDEHPDSLVTGMRILNGIGQLHFGWFGGVPVRIVYGLLGLALCLVTSTGVTIWMARRRDKGRAVPHWERIWAMIAWGQPVIFLATLWAAFLFPARLGEKLPLLWFILTALSILLAAMLRRFSGSILARGLRVTLAILSAALLIAHAVATFSQGQPSVTLVDAILLGTAIVLFWPFLRQKFFNSESAAA